MATHGMTTGITRTTTPPCFEFLRPLVHWILSQFGWHSHLITINHERVEGWLLNCLWFQDKQTNKSYMLTMKVLLQRRLCLHQLTSPWAVQLQQTEKCWNKNGRRQNKCKQKLDPFTDNDSAPKLRKVPSRTVYNQKLAQIQHKTGNSLIVGFLPILSPTLQSTYNIHCGNHFTNSIVVF